MEAVLLTHPWTERKEEKVKVKKIGKRNKEKTELEIDKKI